jgi:hypothetical protein
MYREDPGVAVQDIYWLAAACGTAHVWIGAGVFARIAGGIHSDVCCQPGIVIIVILHVSVAFAAVVPEFVALV